MDTKSGDSYFAAVRWIRLIGAGLGLVSLFIGLYGAFGLLIQYHHATGSEQRAITAPIAAFLESFGVPREQIGEHAFEAMASLGVLGFIQFFKILVVSVLLFGGAKVIYYCTSDIHNIRRQLRELLAESKTTKTGT